MKRRHKRARSTDPRTVQTTVTSIAERERIPMDPVRYTPEEIREVMSQLYREEQGEVPHAEFQNIIPWDIAPPWTWAISLLWRADGALQAYWYVGDQRIPAWSLEHATDEFFVLAQELPAGCYHTFQRSYGKVPALPIDAEFDASFRRIWKEAKQAQLGLTIPLPERRGYKRPDGLVPNQLTVCVMWECERVRQGRENAPRLENAGQLGAHA